MKTTVLLHDRCDQMDHLVDRARAMLQKEYGNIFDFDALVHDTTNRGILSFERTPNLFLDSLKRVRKDLEDQYLSCLKGIAKELGLPAHSDARSIGSALFQCIDNDVYGSGHGNCLPRNAIVQYTAMLAAAKAAIAPASTFLDAFTMSPVLPSPLALEKRQRHLRNAGDDQYLVSFSAHSAMH